MASPASHERRLKIDLLFFFFFFSAALRLCASFFQINTSLALHRNVRRDAPHNGLRMFFRSPLGVRA
jgi:hypothetical protein